MTQRNSDGELQYYPEDTPTFALFSVYDIYLLAPGLGKVASLETVQETANTGDGNGGVGILLDVLRVIGEYGGTMNNTLDTVTTQVLSVSLWLRDLVLFFVIRVALPLFLACFILFCITLGTFLELLCDPVLPAYLPGNIHTLGS